MCIRDSHECEGRISVQTKNSPIITPSSIGCVVMNVIYGKQLKIIACNKDGHKTGWLSVKTMFTAEKLFVNDEISWLRNNGL